MLEDFTAEHLESPHQLLPQLPALLDDESSGRPVKHLGVKQKHRRRNNTRLTPPRKEVGEAEDVLAMRLAPVRSDDTPCPLTASHIRRNSGGTSAAENMDLAPPHER